MLALKGNEDILNSHKIAFLSSGNDSRADVIAAVEWAVAVRNKPCAVVSGFHSRLEWELFDVLCKGKCGIIAVLARSMYDCVPPKLQQLLESGRLLLLSQFSEDDDTPDRQKATMRNALILRMANEIVIGHLEKGGMLETLLSGLEDEAEITLLGNNRA